LVRHRFEDPRLTISRSNKNGTTALVLMDRSVACIVSAPSSCGVDVGHPDVAVRGADHEKEQIGQMVRAVQH
jgi:hypothetical protein